MALRKRKQAGLGFPAPAVLTACFEGYPCRYRPPAEEHDSEAWCYVGGSWSKFNAAQIFMYGEILVKGEYDRRFGYLGELPPLPSRPSNEGTTAAGA